MAVRLRPVVRSVLNTQQTINPAYRQPPVGRQGRKVKFEEAAKQLFRNG
jgi:hypothetical protein